MAKNTTPLPTYKGREPDGHRLNFSGAADNLRHDLGDGATVVLVVRASVRNPAFKTNQFGVMRLHESVVVDHAMVADEETAARLAADAKRREDEESGQASLDADLDGVVDGDE